MILVFLTFILSHFVAYSALAWSHSVESLTLCRGNSEGGENSSAEGIAHNPSIETDYFKSNTERVSEGFVVIEHEVSCVVEFLSHFCLLLFFSSFLINSMFAIIIFWEFFLYGDCILFLNLGNFEFLSPTHSYAK